MKWALLDRGLSTYFQLRASSQPGSLFLCNLDGLENPLLIAIEVERARRKLKKRLDVSIVSGQVGNQLRWEIYLERDMLSTS